MILHQAELHCFILIDRMNDFKTKCMVIIDWRSFIPKGLSNRKVSADIHNSSTSSKSRGLHHFST